jgi:hypothetical protein
LIKIFKSYLEKKYPEIYNKIYKYKKLLKIIYIKEKYA